MQPATKPKKQNKQNKAKKAPSGSASRRQRAQSQPATLTVRPAARRPHDQASFLASVNPYYASLRDPVNCKGARIPDMTTTPSCTFSVVVKGEFIANSAGIGGVMFGGTMSNAADPLAAGAMQTLLLPTHTLEYQPGDNTYIDGPNDWLAGSRLPSTATALDLFAGSATAENATISFEGWDGPTSVVPSSFSHARLVSACLTVAPTGTALNSSGRMVGVSLPRMDTARHGALTLSELENKPGAQSVYINANRAINVLYSPVDPMSWTYAPISSGQANDGGDTGTLVFSQTVQVVSANAVAVANFQVPSGGYATAMDVEQYDPGELWVVATGCQASQPFQFIMTANYEAIPRQAQTMLLQPVASHADPIATASALNAIANQPRVLQGNSNLVPTTAPALEQHPAKPHVSMLDKILTAVGKAGDVASKVAPLIATALA